MFLQAASVLFLALTSTTSSTPLVARNTVAIPLARHFNFTGAAKLLEIDQARAKALRARAATEEAATFPVPVTNTAVSYTAEVGTTIIAFIRSANASVIGCNRYTAENM